MACYHPAKAVRLQNGDVKFVSQSTVDGTLLTLDCKQCVGCRLEYSRQWAIRCLDEAQLHDANSFITLTTSEENVVSGKIGRSLDKSVFQRFMKRLRKEVAPLRTRFFHCGEYTQSLLPHYHALVFGYSFPDRKFFKMNKAGTHKLYVSEQLGRLWTDGYHYIGDVSFESAAYVARYVMKKVKTTRDDEDRLIVKSTGEVLLPEYVTMSRGSGDGSLVFDGGIGSGWYKKFKGDVYPHGKRIVRGRDMRPPRFYDQLYAVDDPFGYEDMKFVRESSVDKGDNTMSRLVAKEEVTVARLKLFPRE